MPRSHRTGQEQLKGATTIARGLGAAVSLERWPEACQQSARLA